MASEILDSEDDAALAGRRMLMHVGIAAAIIVVGIIVKDQFSWVAKYPRKWVIPLKNRITDFFEWLVYGVRFFVGTRFEFVPTDITRGMIKIFEYQVFLPKVCSSTASGSGWSRAFSNPRSGDSAGGYSLAKIDESGAAYRDPGDHAWHKPGHIRGPVHGGDYGTDRHPGPGVGNQSCPLR